MRRKLSLVFTLVTLACTSSFLLTRSGSAVVSQETNPRGVIEAKPLPDFDIRLGERREFQDYDLSSARAKQNALQSISTPTALDALEQFRASLASAENLRVLANESGAIKNIFVDGAPLASAQSGTPDTIARNFLNQHSSLFLLSAQDVANLKLTREDPDDGTTFLSYVQRIGNVKVFEGEVKVVVNQKGEVLSVREGFLVSDQTVNLTPRLPESQALAKAFELCGRKVEGAFTQIESGPGDLSIHANPLGSEFESVLSELVVVRINNGARLAWHVYADVGPNEWYELLFDADSGELLFRRNLYVSEAQGTVFPVHPDFGARQLRSFLGDTTINTAVGWMGTSTVTTGNNVEAYLDADDNNAPDPNNGSGLSNGHAFASTQDFTFPFSLVVDPRTQQAGVVTNLFYLNNVMHDFSYGLGFTETAGNFQTSNFGRGGSGSDSVRAEAQDGSGINNANFATPPDGVRPRMQQYLFETANPVRDSSMDSDVVYHEYGHGISTRLIGNGGGGLSGLQSGAMGEGWSDYWAITINNDGVMGEYVTRNSLKGIRRAAYTVPAATVHDSYADLLLVDKQPHPDGEVWAATLFDLRAQLGPATADRLVLNGMKFTPFRPSFLAARDGILQADQNLNAGANRCAIWAVFARHGMGVSAVGNDGTTHVAATDTPSDCGGGSNCASTPITNGQTVNGTLTTSDCRYPTGSSWYADAYSFSGTAGQQVAISMSSATFDTWVALVGPNGSELVFDDDGGGGTNSRIPATSGFFVLPSSGTYIIQASSAFVNATGSYTVMLTASAGGVGNNNFANAQLISGSDGNTTGNNTGATKESGEPNHAGNLGGASVWYLWQAPASTPVTMKTAGSSFDTLLAVYTGSSVNTLTTIVSNDDSAGDLTSRVTFNAVAGTTYRIAIDGYNGATGSLALNWNSGATGPANNNFASATTIAGNSGTITGNNASATKETGEPSHGGNSGGVSVWYQWQAPANGSVTISTANSNFDTLLGVYTGTTLSGLTTIASNDDESFPSVLTSKVTFNAIAGTTYRIAVDGYEGTTGNITLNWNLSGAIQVTVQTNPSGRTFTVDGTSFSSGQTFSWTPGSSHTISTTSPQSGTTGTQYVWNNWSDGGAISHVVSPTSAATFTANFTTQFFLTMNAGAGGTVSPASAFFNSGQVVNISATPNPNFSFSGWSGSGPGSFTGATNPASVTMNGPITETGSFTGSSSTLQFSAASYVVGEAVGFATITVTRSGGSVGSASVAYTTSNGTGKEGKNYVAAIGVVSFAAGETSKTFPVLIIDNSLVEGARTVNLALTAPSGATLGAPNTTVLTINENDSSSGSNPLDVPRSFVQYDYYDFLGRYPDISGWDFWTNQIANCGSNAQCIEVQRINVSASFFLSIEFQQTGYLVERMYKVAFGNASGNSTFGGAHQLPVPIVRFDEFLRDSQRIGRGVIVLAPGWEQLLESNKQAYANEFVQTTRFIAALPTTMTPAQFVDQLNLNAGNVLSASERTAAINLFGAAANSSNATARAQAVRQVAEDTDLYNAEYNRAFVLAEYFGYLRRNPNDAPESTLDYTGYDFWLAKLNQFNGNYINAEMVKAFLSSIEYRQRFGP